MYVPDDGGREEGWVEVAIFTTGASLLRVYYDHHSKTLSLVHCTVDDIFTSYDERRSEMGIEYDVGLLDNSKTVGTSVRPFTRRDGRPFKLVSHSCLPF